MVETMVIAKNGWNEWSKHVLMELERLNKCYDRLDEKIDKVNIDIVKLRTKASVWGAIGGALGGIILTAITSIIIHVITK